ncbi:MAG: HAD family phosphatase [Gordonia sp.]|nr:HAD family phosphatase [Gordonia sp. (in: high G+C Gram-positive bacteria)]OZG27294.1 haloacid dehalogenase [Williamsia sp. 1138]
MDDVNIRLVATDLDGTLLNSARAVSPRSAASMAAAADAGIIVVWATARAKHSVHALATTCGFRGIAVAANGAVLIDLADGTPNIVDIQALTADVARAATERVRELVPGTVFATVGPTRFVADHGYAALCVFTDHHRDPATMERSDAASLDDEPIVKIVARHPDIASEVLFRRVQAAGMPEVTPTHSGAPYLEMAALGVSKATALARLCARWDIDRSEVAACGDAINDLPMLSWAGQALCPANASVDALAVADHVLPSNDDDGVATYLESLIAATAEVERPAGHTR